jgi:hypothetical protein
VGAGVGACVGGAVGSNVGETTGSGVAGDGVCAAGAPHAPSIAMRSRTANTETTDLFIFFPPVYLVNNINFSYALREYMHLAILCGITRLSIITFEYNLCQLLIRQVRKGIPLAGYININNMKILVKIQNYYYDMLISLLEELDESQVN